jgi:hypothetical protein
MKYCCKDFEDEAEGWSSSFVYEENEWRIFTDMEGGRYVLNKPLKYCPFCGQQLAKIFG